MQVFSSASGFLLILIYAVFMFGITWFFTNGLSKTKSEFLVANREISKYPAAFSIAATWIWAPALFIASQKAYTQGWVGVFWFTVPNILCLIIFAYFADMVRKKIPQGFTLSGFIQEKYKSKRLQGVYIFQLIGLSICSFAVQLLAGGLIISNLTGISFLTVTSLLSLIPLAYSLFSGIKASITTDYLQMIIIGLIGFIAVPWVIIEAGGLSTIASGFYGHSGKFTSLFSGDGLSVFWAFGIPVTIGLMSGPFGDQSFWQRAFSVKKDCVKSSFITGALIFGVVPLLLSLLGFVAAGVKLQVESVQLVNMETVLHFLPQWVAVPFTYMLLSGLISTIDSNICSFSSIMGHDLNKGNFSIKKLRIAMIVFSMCALIIANIPNMKILYLFLFYGTLRSSTLLPTIISILYEKISETGVYYGILLAITIGLPVFAYGNFYNMLGMKLAGCLFTVLFPAIAIIIYQYILLTSPQKVLY